MCFFNFALSGQSRAGRGPRPSPRERGDSRTRVSTPHEELPTSQLRTEPPANVKADRATEKRRDDQGVSVQYTVVWVARELADGEKPTTSCSTKGCRGWTAYATGIASWHGVRQTADADTTRDNGVGKRHIISDRTAHIRPSGPRRPMRTDPVATRRPTVRNQRSVRNGQSRPSLVCHGASAPPAKSIPPATALLEAADDDPP